MLDYFWSSLFSVLFKLSLAIVSQTSREISVASKQECAYRNNLTPLNCNSLKWIREVVR